MDQPVSQQTDDQLRAIIHRLYALMIQAFDYNGSQTTTAMTNEIKMLIQDLSTFSRTSLNIPSEIPEYIINYVENGRNPDIYNREFVETVQNLNQQMKGRNEAYEQFRDILAKEIKNGIPEIEKEVEEVMNRTGGS